MSYKYPIMARLAEDIRDGTLPEDLDFYAIYRFWVKHHPPADPTTKRKPRPKPRFYSRAKASNYRSKKLGAEGSVTADDLESIFAKYQGQCAICESTSNLVFDHKLPYYRGGDNTPENIQLLCRACNTEKGVN